MAGLCLHGHVRGRVQGVGFRQATAAEAHRLNLAGWVRNLQDGRVEVWAEGEAAAVRALASWLENGPPHAQVTDLDLQEQPCQNLQGFQIRR